jgi:hypothetical protein|tara:strand:+ start:3055 stop:3414 length:360 start_codon:yes stop_codon:yes gene_type:complete
MTDIKLTVENDIEIINGKLNLVATKDELVVQLVKIAIGTYQGEWYLDNTIGVPYYQSILKKGVNKVLVDSIFRRVISDTRGVARILKFESTVNNYEYNMSFTFQSETGTISSIFESVAL